MRILTNHRSETARYTAEELSKYVRLITNCEIMPTIEYTDTLPALCDDAVVLATLDELLLDTSDLSDPFIEDIIDVDVRKGRSMGYILRSHRGG